ncbi:MAG: beta-galactosidase small subunit, partial [bacterium]|nr:beta-galactosidase small subunit [bacterium]
RPGPGRPGRAERSGSLGLTRPGKPTLIDDTHNVGVRGENFAVVFSKLRGGLSSYRYGLTPDGGRELLRGIPRPNFWHAPTDNENGWGMSARDGRWLLASRYAQAAEGGPAVTDHGDRAEIRFTYAFPEGAGECQVGYVVDGNGRVEVTLEVAPADGMPDAPEFGLLMEVPAELGRVRWYGEGPEECYVDRREGARLGVYERAVAEMLPGYVRPQESGSRTGVRWARVTDEQGRGLLFEAEEPMEFSALPWSPFEIENAAHPVDLPPVQRTVVRPALIRRAGGRLGPGRPGSRSGGRGAEGGRPGGGWWAEGRRAGEVAA